MYLLLLAYEVFPFMAGVYAIGVYLAQPRRPAWTIWLVGIVLALVLAGLSTIALHRDFQHTVPFRPLIASSLCLYGIPMLAVLATVSHVQTRVLKRKRGVLLIVLVFMVALIASRQAAAYFFNIVNAPA